MDYTLNFDGGIWPNPGGNPKYGYSIADCQGNVYEDSGQIMDLSEESRTNNVAEWYGLIHGLYVILRLASESPINTLLIRGDSKLIINQISGKWGCRKAHLAALHDMAQNIIRQIQANNVVFEWVPRDKNKRADALTRVSFS